jgi:DNA-binding transcriptional ArsR family regulator
MKSVLSRATKNLLHCRRLESSAAGARGQARSSEAVRSAISRGTVINNIERYRRPLVKPLDRPAAGNRCREFTGQKLSIRINIVDVVEDDSQGVVVLLDALAEPSRLKVVQLLCAGPRRAGELADEVGLSAPAMSKHLRVLLRAGVLCDERLEEDARARVFRLRPESIVAVRAWLDQLQAEWDVQLASFKSHAEDARRRASGAKGPR